LTVTPFDSVPLANVYTKAFMLMHAMELMLIYLLQHFEKLFQFARRIEELMYNMSPEEVRNVIWFGVLSESLCNLVT